MDPYKLIDPPINTILKIFSMLQQQLQQKEEKKKQDAGLILSLLSEYGGEISPEQLGAMEKSLKTPKGLISSIFQPTYEEVKTPMTVAQASGEEDVIDMVSQGKLKGYKLPGKQERALKTKEKELALEHPFKKELEELKTTSREKIADIQTQAHVQSIKEKIDVNQKLIEEKIASAEKISAAGNASKEQIAAANNEVRMSVNNLTQQVELLKTILMTQSKEKIAAGVQATEEKKISAKEGEDKKAMSEIDKRKSFNDDVLKAGFIDPNTKTWKSLSREEADSVKNIAESYGYVYGERPVKTGVFGLGSGGFMPQIDFKPRKTKEQKTEVGTKPKQGAKTEKDAKALIDEANKAIKNGADPEAVKKRLKEQFGIEVE